MATTAAQRTIVVDGKHFNPEDLSDNAHTQLRGVRFADDQLRQLNNKRALFETARAAYGRNLSGHLPENKAAANKKKDVITIDGEKYNLADFSEEGRVQLANVQFVMEELQKLGNEKAVIQTARKQYARALSEELKSVTPVTQQ